MGFFFLIGFLVGIALAVGITLFIMISVIKRANDWGDSDGIEASMAGFMMLESKNNVKKTYMEGRYYA